MGLYDRDYYRKEPRTSASWGGDGTVCRKIVLVTAAIFILQVLTLGRRAVFSPVADWLLFDVESCFQHGQLWRLVSYAFVHSEDDLWHIVGNMLCLWFFGPDIESIYGSWEFLRFYLTAAAIAALCQVGLSLALNEDAKLIGASGAVMAVMMLFAINFPRRKVYVMGVIPVEIRWLIALYVAFDAYPVWQRLAGFGGGGNVAHAAHLGGLLYGLLYWKFDLRHNLWGRLGSLFSWTGLKRSIRQQRTVRSGNIRPYRPEEYDEPPLADSPSEFNARVDTVLAKISREGESSLTVTERELLAEAARRYKRRS
ncbi:MAG: rhomboid family intramembrane serine protease [Planctomycetaceae bacterium]|nr:MAG: rhomboid family intramembrane serine protease [Planctomycetaceae bacterium]